MSWGGYLIAVLILKTKWVKRLCETVCHSGEPHISVKVCGPWKHPFSLGQGQGSVIRGAGAC